MTVNVKDVLNDRASLEGHYVILVDKSSDETFVNMTKALNKIVEKGWECVSITAMRMGERLGETHAMYALMRKKAN